MAKRRIWARLARAAFNGIGIGGLAGWTIYGLMKALSVLAEGMPDPAASGALMFFLFFAGSIGIELSKDLEETAAAK